MEIFAWYIIHFIPGKNVCNSNYVNVMWKQWIGESSEFNEVYKMWSTLNQVLQFLTQKYCSFLFFVVGNQILIFSIFIAIMINSTTQALSTWSFWLMKAMPRTSDIQMRKICCLIHSWTSTWFPFIQQHIRLWWVLLMKVTQAWEWVGCSCLFVFLGFLAHKSKWPRLQIKPWLENLFHSELRQRSENLAILHPWDL